MCGKRQYDKRSRKQRGRDKDGEGTMNSKCERHVKVQKNGRAQEGSTAMKGSGEDKKSRSLISIHVKNETGTR